MTITIVEVIKQADQGLSSPFLCRGDDDLLYFVKGRASGRASQWAEWLAGHLGQALDLPIPAFRLVDVPVELARECPPELRGIGAGIAFGSRRVEACQWLETVAAAHVPEDLRRDLFVFDWWVRNEDRTRGNPNLLWEPASGSAVVIDHNQAFAPDFDPARFMEHHLFAADGMACSATSSSASATRNAWNGPWAFGTRPAIMPRRNGAGKTTKGTCPPPSTL